MATVRYTVAYGQILAEKRAGSRKLYRSDALGSTVALYDNTQAKTDTFTYWPYGETRTSSGSTGTKYRYIGTFGCREQSDGAIYMRARIQQPEDGRWQTMDRLWPAESAYAYALGNPMTIVDPEGARPQVRCSDKDDYKRYKDALDKICNSNLTSSIDTCIQGCCVEPDGTPLAPDCIKNICSDSTLTIIECIGRFGPHDCKHGNVCAQLDNDGRTITICNKGLPSWGKVHEKCSDPVCVLLHEMIHRCGAKHAGKRGKGAAIMSEESKRCFGCVELFPGCAGYGDRNMEDIGV